MRLITVMITVYFRHTVYKIRAEKSDPLAGGGAGVVVQGWSPPLIRAVPRLLVGSVAPPPFPFASPRGRMAQPEPELAEGVPPTPAWTPSESSFAVKKKQKDGKKGTLELEEGGKFGGKFAKWKKLHFVIRGDRLMVFENVLENE
eukprot:COSAG02_NODE_31928_length_525_cov_0.723005_1_plen_144_part_01